MKIMNIFTNTVILDLWFEVYCIILKIEKSFVMSRKRKGTWFKESISQRS